MLCSRHLELYEQCVPPLLQLYEQHCPGFFALLALDCKGQGLRRLFTEIWWETPLVLAPIVHPQRWDPDGPELTNIDIPEPGVHPLLTFILAPRVLQIHLEIAISCLCYLQTGGHSFKSRKSLKLLLKSRYFTRLKMRPSLSRFRKKRHHYSSGRCLLDEQDFHSTWWGDYNQRPCDYVEQVDKRGVLVPLRFFSYQSQYASNYDLWCTYRHALQLLSPVLANSPPDPRLAFIATNCIFNFFCTAYPQETRRAKKSIARYLCRCGSIGAMPLRGRIVGDIMSGMEVD